MHRSGSSALTQALTKSGAFVGEPDELLPAADDNITGFFERQDALSINRALMSGAGGAWWRLARLELDTIPKDTLEDCRKRFDKMVARLDRADLWALKDPRLCLVLPKILDLLSAPVAIVVYRNPLDVAQSLYQRNNMAISEGLALWDAYYRAALWNSKDIPRVLVSYEDLLNDPRETLQTLARQLRAVGVEGLNPPGKRKLREFLFPSLAHHVTPDAEAERHLIPSQRKLFRALRDGKAFDGKLPAAPDAIVQQHLRDLEFRHGTLMRQTNKAEETRSELAQTREQAKKHADRAAALERARKVSSEKLDQLNQMLESRQAENSELRRNLSAAEKKLEARDQQVSDLQSEVNRVSATLKRARKVSSEKLDQLNQMLESRQAENSELRRNLSAVEKKLEARDQQVSDLQSEVNRVSAHQKDVERDLDQCRKDLSARNRQVSDLQAKLEQVASELERTQALLDQRQQELSEVTRQLARARRAASDALVMVGKTALMAMGRVKKGPFKKLRENRRVRLLRQRGLLDEDWYAREYSDVRESGVSPARHYLRYGAEEGRFPSLAVKRALTDEG